MLELRMKIFVHFLKPSQGISQSSRCQCWINTVDKITRCSNPSQCIPVSLSESCEGSAKFLNFVIPKILTWPIPVADLN